MSRLVVIALVALSTLIITEDANAWRRRRRTSYSSTTTVTSSVSITTSYQARAQAKANLMASHRRVSHYIGGMGLCGPKEGVGCGSSRYCGTCTFSGTLVADAAAQSSSGLWYRVRVWR